MQKSRLKLLIISSEKLYPGHTIGSTFELSQAQILSAIAEVAILSVSQQLTLLPTIKQNLGISKPYPGLFLPGYSVFFRSFLSGNRIVRKHLIEGINVFEGIDATIKSSGDFKSSLKNWIKAGWAAFEKYVAENGLPDLIHAHGRFLNAGVLAEQVFKKYRVKYIYTEHSTYYQRGIAPEEARPILKSVLQNSGANTFVGKVLLEKVQEFLGEKLERPLITRNALDRIFETPVNRSPALQRNSYLLCIASLDEKKGIDILIRAYNEAFKANKPKLYICGEGGMRNSLTELIKLYGLEEYVFLLGNQTKKEIVNHLDNCAFFVLPSIFETFGVVVIEALSRGCPVVATKSGGPEFILDESNGILTEPGDMEGLAVALTKMMDSLPDFHRDKIRQNALQRFGSQAFVEEISKIYNSVLQ